MLAGWGSWEGEGGQAPRALRHLPRPFPAPAPTTLGRKGAHSQWGPVRVLEGVGDRTGCPQLPHLTRISAYSASSSVRV